MPYLSGEELVEFTHQIENKEIAETKEILMRQNKDGFSVAHRLAWRADTTNWSTDDKEILLLQDKDGDSVAHWLASWHLTWITDDLEILSLANRWGRTVEDTLVKRGKI